MPLATPEPEPTSRPHSGRLARAFEGWGRAVHRWRWWVVALWLVVLAVAAPAAGRLEGALQGGTGAIAGSTSASVERRLREEFDNPFAQSLVLVVSSERETLLDQAFTAFVRRSASAMAEVPGVKRLLSPLDGVDPRLVSADRHRAVVLVGLGGADVGAAERAVPKLRRAIAPAGEAARQQDASLDWALTGRGALTYDINRFSTADSGRAEGRSFPLTAAVLVLAFGSLVAAALPLAMGTSAILLALGALFALTAAFELSTLAQSVTSMLGLAMGIDYALLMVTRFREALGRGLGNREAIAETMGTAGLAVAGSGLTVAIGFCGLLLTSVLDTRSMGLGGLVVAAVTVVLALTLLPAVLAILGPRVDAPRWLRLPRLTAGAGLWSRLAERVADRPWVAVVGALSVIAVLAAPAFTLKSGFPLGRWLPERLEYQRGFDALVAMGRGGLAAPVDVILTADDMALAPRHVGDLLAYSRRLHEDSRVAGVLGPVDLREGLPAVSYRLLYADPQQALERFPLIGEMFLSRDRHSTYFQVFLDDKVTFEESKAFSALLGRTPPPGYRVAVGGQGAFYRDFDRVMEGAVPVVVAFVVVSTLVAMAIAFRSVLVPLKAVAMNMLSVAAGLGVVVAVFQHGLAGALFGVEHPLGQIPLTVSLSLFCIVFGLSMDYEVFLLSRIKEEYDGGADNRQATVSGLAATAGVITSAAAIMVCVFGAFAGAELVLVQMLGLGLAVAVLVDATVVRLLLVPALMRLAGDWNWWPGNSPLSPAGERDVVR